MNNKNINKMEIKFEFNHPCGVTLYPGKPGTKEVMRFRYKNNITTLYEDEVPKTLMKNFQSTNFASIMIGLEAVVQCWDKLYGQGKMDNFHSVYQAWVDWCCKED